MVKAGRTLLRRDTGLAGEGGEGVEAFATPGTVSAVVPFADERGADGLSARNVCTQRQSEVIFGAVHALPPL
jgi:hypothetical protein